VAVLVKSVPETSPTASTSDVVSLLDLTVREFKEKVGGLSKADKTELMKAEKASDEPRKSIIKLLK